MTTHVIVMGGVMARMVIDGQGKPTMLEMVRGSCSDENGYTPAEPLTIFHSAYYPSLYKLRDFLVEHLGPGPAKEEK